MSKKRQGSALVMLDTNALLHYSVFDKIKWRELPDLNTFKEVNLYIGYSTLDEIHDKSSTESGWVRKRAERAGRKIEGFLERIGKDDSIQLRHGEYLVFYDKDPEVSKYKLKPDVQDNLLITLALELSEEKKQCVFIATADIPLRLKVRKREQLFVIVPPDEAKIPRQQSEAEKRVEKLEKENARLRKQYPDLKLCFEDGTQTKIHSTKTANSEKDLEKYLNQIIERVNIAYPELPRNAAEKAFERLYPQDYIYPGRREKRYETIDQYIALRNEHIEKVKEWAKKYFSYWLFSPSIKIFLQNERDAMPAKNVKVTIKTKEELTYFDNPTYHYIPNSHYTRQERNFSNRFLAGAEPQEKLVKCRQNLHHFFEELKLNVKRDISLRSSQDSYYNPISYTTTLSNYKPIIREGIDLSQGHMVEIESISILSNKRKKNAVSLDYEVSCEGKPGYDNGVLEIHWKYESIT